MQNLKNITPSDYVLKMQTRFFFHWWTACGITLSTNGFFFSFPSIFSFNSPASLPLSLSLSEYKTKGTDQYYIFGLSLFYFDSGIVVFCFWRFDDGRRQIWLWEICYRCSLSPHLLPHPWATYFNFSLSIIKLKFVWSQNTNPQQGRVQVKWDEGALDVVVPNVQDLQPNAIGQRFW
jgi:hypothetical protein